VRYLDAGWPEAFQAVDTEEPPVTATTLHPEQRPVLSISMTSRIRALLKPKKLASLPAIKHSLILPDRRRDSHSTPPGERIIRAVSQMTNVQEFSLHSGDSLPMLSPRFFRTALSAFGQSLQTLNLTICVSAIPNLFSAFPVVTELQEMTLTLFMEWKAPEREDISFLLPFMASVSSALHHLSISFPYELDSCMAFLLENLGQLPALTKFTHSVTGICAGLSFTYPPSLSSFLQSKVEKLQELSLNVLDFSTPSSDFFGGLSSSSLQTLNVPSELLRQGGYKDSIKALAANATHMDTLCILGTLSYEDICTLAVAFSRHSHLTRLQLTCNALRIDLIDSLAINLSSLNSLTLGVAHWKRGFDTSLHGWRVQLRRVGAAFHRLS
jgi:hypothetical protein